MKLTLYSSSVILAVGFTIYMIAFGNQYYFFDDHIGYRNGTMFLTGDEPHYILLTKNLVENHSFFMEKTYGKPYSDMLFAMGTGWHATYHNGHYIPNHGIGLPLLMALPYIFGGTYLAISIIAFLSAMLNVVIYKTCNQFVSKKISFITSMIFAFATLLFPYSNQVYPDVIMGLLILTCLNLAFFHNPSRKIIALIGSLLAFGILLKITFFLAVAILIPIVILRLIKHKKITRLPFLFLSASPLILIFAWFNYISFGNPISYPSYCPSCDGNPLVGLSLMMFDKFGGIITFSPILILSFYGVYIGYKKNHGFIISTIIIAVLWALFNAINRGVGWGEDLPARYLITIVPLAAIPFACALERYYMKPIFLGSTILLTVIGLALSVGMASNRWIGLASANSSSKSQLLNLVYRGVEQIFPSLYGKEFGTYDWSIASWYNVAYVITLSIIMIVPLIVHPIQKISKNFSRPSSV